MPKLRPRICSCRNLFQPNVSTGWTDSGKEKSGGWFASRSLLALFFTLIAARNSFHTALPSALLPRGKFEVRGNVFLQRIASSANLARSIRASAVHVGAARCSLFACAVAWLWDQTT
jgi:hypothetical protein